MKREKDIYDAIRAELARRCRSIRYFNRDFFRTYTEAVKAGAICEKNGVDDSYYSGIVLLFHHYDDIYKSDFYQKNSSTYCEFLCVAYDYTESIRAAILEPETIASAAA